ncbi:MAG: response regulator, partial [Deltaproteobacteria bacterium]|nr:response regulator [Deltaproteobacteria bacterium]
EKDFVDSLSERLSLRNLDAKIAYDGEQALEAVKEGEPDVMVLDLRMPGIDGLDVLRRVRKTNPNVQVVVLTGHGTEKEEKLARKLGAVAYMKKPVDIDQLVGTMHKAWKKLKKSRDKMDQVIMAAAFAQAGEVEIARETMAEMMHETEEDEKQGSEKTGS